MKDRLSLKVSVSGVRGVIGESLTPRLAARFAQAFGTYLGGGKVVVGRDARLSGPMLQEAVTAGLLAVGCRPVDVGLCPIPSFQVLTKALQARGGIAITASHNPGEWNGLKFIGEAGLFLNRSRFAEFNEIYHQGEFALVPADKMKPAVREEAPLKPHLDRLLAALDVDLVRRRRFRVAIDCANGAGAALAPEFLRRLGCRPILVNAVPHGRFERPPEPVPENLGSLKRAVRADRADVGFAQDADADRLAVVDEAGRPLGEELTLALAVNRVLSSRTAGPVAVNLSTTRAIDDIAAAAGVPVFRTRIGEINVVEEILEREAAIGGEGNGGVIWPAVRPCRDSFAAMGLVLELMAASGKRPSALRREIPAYHMVKDKVPGTARQAHLIGKALKKMYAGKGEVVTLDGVKVVFADSWVHLRPSNTEPIIRILAEARTKPEAVRLVRLFKAEVKRRAS
ncbi:MAG: phosphoglucosamine mutase [Candidatus Aminicenantes bacterium]|nr:phosphoglucosamine mutase [Candidatus Aminicenantes bacterium]